MAVFPRLGLLFISFLLPLGIIAAWVMGSVWIGILVGIVAVLSWWKPQWMLLILIGFAPFVRSPRSDLVSPEFIAQTKTLFTFVYCVVWCLRRPHISGGISLPNWLRVFLFLWFSLLALSLINAFDGLAASKYICGSVAGVGLFIIAYFEAENMGRKILVVTFLVAGVITFISLLQFVMASFHLFPFLWKFLMAPREVSYLQFDTSTQQVLYRVAGTFLHPNQLGTYFLFLIPLAVALLPLPVFKGWKRVGFIIFIGLMFIGIYVTNSRASIFGLAVSLLVLGVHRGYRWLAAGGGILVFVVLSAFLFSQPFNDYLRKVTRWETGISSRGQVWTNVKELIEKNKAWGVGPGNLPERYVSDFGFFVFENPGEWRDQMVSFHTLGDVLIQSCHAHNLYLQMAAELGILGPPLFFLGIGLIIFNGVKKARGLPVNTLERALGVAAFAICVGFIGWGFFDTQLTFTRFSLNLLAGPLLALGVRAC